MRSSWFDLREWFLKFCLFISRITIIIKKVIHTKLDFTSNFFLYFWNSFKSSKYLKFLLYHGPKEDPYWYTSLYQSVECGRGTGRDVAASQSSAFANRCRIRPLWVLLTWCVNLSAQFVVQKSKKYANACSETSVGSLKNCISYCDLEEVPETTVSLGTAAGSSPMREFWKKPDPPMIKSGPRQYPERLIAEDKYC